MNENGKTNNIISKKIQIVDQTKPLSPLRWPILVLACLMLIGSYYCYDIPAALKTQIDDYMGDPSDYETLFSLLYTLYSAPNVILPFFGGYFVDVFGVRLCLLIFASLIAVGQIIFSLGLSIKSWPVLFIGRLVFGFGGESLTVANSALLADWFKGKELAFAFGVNLAIARLGSVINNVVSPALARTTGVLFASWFGVILCAASVLCVVITLPIDRNMDIKRKLYLNESSGIQGLLKLDEDINDDVDMEQVRNSLLNKDSSSISNSSSSSTTAAVAVEANGKTISYVKGINDDEKKSNDNNVKLADVFSFSRMFWMLVALCVIVYGCVLPFNNVASSLLQERDYFKSPPSSCQLEIPTECQSDTNQPNEGCTSLYQSEWYQPPLPMNVNITGIGYFSGQLTGNDIDCTNSLWSGSDGCTYEYCQRQATAESKAAVIMSIPYIISGVLSPFLGIFVDYFGCRAIIATLSPAFLIVVHFLLGYTNINPIGPLVGQGLAYTGFAAVLWPAIPLVVEERLTGFGFGVITALLNLGTAVLPLVVAAIYNISNSYIPRVELLFACLGIFGFLCGLIVNWEDYYNYNSVLNRVDLSLFDKNDDSGPNSIDRGMNESLLGNEEGNHNRTISIEREGRQNSRGGSFTSYGEILIGGGFDKQK